MSGWWREAPGGMTISVRLTPKGGRDAIDGVGAGADGRAFLKARVAAPPEDGKANAALAAMIARRAGVPKTAVSVAAGPAARRKTLHIACTGDERGEIAGKLGG